MPCKSRLGTIDNKEELIFRSCWVFFILPLDIPDGRVNFSPDVKDSTEYITVFGRFVEVDTGMLNLFLKKMERWMSATGVQLDFVP